MKGAPMKYPNLFSEGKIGTLILKNRVIMPSMGTFLSSSDGEVTDRQIAYFEERAKGGTGLIIPEVTAVDYSLGKCGPVHPRVDDPKYIPMLYRLANTVHKHGTKIVMQLGHAGRQTDSTLTGGMQAVAPSPVPCEILCEVPRELTVAEIKDIVARYINAAVICKMAAMDGVELHGAHGYLINQFMSPKTNKRTDAYGGGFEARMRFAKEIVEGIKAQCGPDYPVIMRLSVDEFVTGGITMEEGVRIAKYMEKIGVDAINVSCGIFDSLRTFIEPITFEQGWRVYLSEAVKKAVKIPVITVGVIREPGFAEKIIQKGKADFVAIGRGLIADPDWCNKALTGKESEIRKCISCMYCLDRDVMRTHIGCAVNVRAGRELEFKDFNRNGNRKKVVVAGGGPGGMEAARILAQRNFKVVLFEKEEILGGQLNYGNKPLGKDKLNWFIQYLAGQLKNLKVDVKLGREITASAVKKEKPYAVFVATGAKPILPGIDGINNKNVCVVQDALMKAGSFKGKTVAVIGGGMTGCETAEFLASKGARVYLIEMLPEVAVGAGFVDKMDMVQRLADANVKILTDHRLMKIKDDSIFVKSASEKKEIKLSVDKVVLALGSKPDRQLYDQVSRACDNVFLLGDALAPGRIANAVQDAFEKAILLE
jgi:2,4-dienoyl-CoA reductase-like NADH-dependent reductase (Old Yellow Enzyme family)/thioredoxin reductase